VLLLIFAIGIAVDKQFVPPVMLILAAICLFIYPLDIYRAQLQATQRFHFILGAELAKHLVALAAFLILIAQGQSLEIAIISQFSVIAIFHIIYFILFAGKHINFQNILADLRRRLALSAPKQARTYSLAAMLSASLEHIDKILVGWVFGLEFLGLYTLAFSTGRIFYNMLKPAFYIYYRRFVDTMPSRDLLVKTGIAFSVLGAICATLFLLATAHIPAMSKFEDGSAVTVILFLSYGIGIVRALYYQAFALNRASVARHALIASTQAACVSLVLLALALSMPPAAALLMLALQYPVRDGLTVALLARRQRRQA
jgi:O-antigen/teichoic acid export membrane protein